MRASCARTLSASDRETPPSEELLALLRRDERELPGPASELARKLPDAPHRRKLVLAAHRLAATRTGERAGYPSPSAFLEDLRMHQLNHVAACLRGKKK